VEINKLFDLKLVLGSGSPRRAELLELLGFKFEIRKKDTDESFLSDWHYLEIPQKLSARKASAIEVFDNELLITADTIVHINGDILNKPDNYEEAFEMLSKLSANTHEVVTGVSFKYQNEIYSFAEETKVSFKKLTHEEIDYYVTYYKPFDKAGAYGIQEWIGMIGIEKIEGDYYNVMGLPVQRVWNELLKIKQ